MNFMASAAAFKFAMSEQVTISSDDDSDSSDAEDDFDTALAFVDSITRKKTKATCQTPEEAPPPPKKKLKLATDAALGFPEPTNATPAATVTQDVNEIRTGGAAKGCKQFWKAGDYECDKEKESKSASESGGMDNARTHPKFLHSNATSHKWALGAFAELLDNSVAEVRNGATYVNINILQNKKDGNRMLVVEDDGGGMTPEKMRQCMSLGSSEKSKVAKTIGQYGNGFKTSTMRLGADVIVFSRCQGINGRSPTQTIGLLSYTLLRTTGKEDIVVPMIDYERRGRGWEKSMQASQDDWTRNLETIVQWSPYSTEEDLLQQFNLFKGHGTRIVIYNLWEDDDGHLELDFDTDPHDIQLRAVNRDEKSIQMSTQYPNSRQFLTYRYSLRTYASILYLKLPSKFRVILRGKDVKHHNIVNDMMMTKMLTYRPVNHSEGMPKNSNMVAKVTLGFVKDAHSHIDIQGFNFYHKNRLIKPFWRVWDAAGSDGRGVIGVLEANFVEPAHNKQGFERTNVLQRLVQRLIRLQKDFWSTNYRRVGCAPRRRTTEFLERDFSASDKERSPTNQNDHGGSKSKACKNLEKRPSTVTTSSEDGNCNEALLSSPKPQLHNTSNSQAGHTPLRIADANGHAKMDRISNPLILPRTGTESSTIERSEVGHESDLCMSLRTELKKANERNAVMEKEYKALIEVLVEEKTEREQEEERLRNRLTDASKTIDDLLEKVRWLEGRTIGTCKMVTK